MDDALFPAEEIPEIAPARAEYRVLARKYRPASFDSLLGQDAMVRTLGNAIARQQIAQAWLLTGVRGVGKTSTARIIAKALNCTGADGQGGPTIAPCGVCVDRRGSPYRCRRNGRRIEHRRR
jgi:DNA polymerase-3 subunit gamma/tau